MVNLCSSAALHDLPMAVPYKRNTGEMQISKHVPHATVNKKTITRNQPRGAKLKIYRSGSSSLIWCDFQLCQRIIIIEYKSNEYMLSYCMFKHCISYSLCKKCFKIIQKKNKRVGVGLGLEYWIRSLRKDPFKDS